MANIVRSFVENAIIHEVARATGVSQNIGSPNGLQAQM